MKAARCPICGKPAIPQNQPFCSPRCADVDLHHWLTGRYVVPDSADPDEPGEPDPADGED